MDLDPAVWGQPAEVNAFSATGDEVGSMSVTENRIDISVVSESGGLGQLPGQPMLVITVPVLPNPAAATTIAFPSARSSVESQCEDVYGYQYTVSARPATFRVGGSFSIDSVSPGGGMLPSATKVRIAGRGFAPAAKVQIEGVALASIAFAGPQLIEATLAAPADLTGRRVLVVNPDGSTADFYSALRGKTTYRSYSYFGVVRPILPRQTFSYANIINNYFAVQNPTLEPVNFFIEHGATYWTRAYSSVGSLDPGETYIFLPVPELHPAPLSLRSEFPIRMSLAPSAPYLQDQVGLVVAWDPKPSCYGAYPLLAPSPPCWLGTAGTAPLVAHASVTWNNAVRFTVSATRDAGQWLTVTVASDRACVLHSGTPCSPQITLTADPSLPAGDYKATVTVSADDPTLLPVSLPFTFRVTPTTISIDAPSYLWFSVNDSIYSRGPARIPVSSPSPGTPFSVKVRDQDTGWLSVTPTEGVTPAVLEVYVNPSPSQYFGSGGIDISGPSNTLTELVNMVIPNPPEPAAVVLTSTPSSLTFWAKAGGTSPPPQVAAVNAYLDTVTAEAEHDLRWLSALSVASGVSVSVDPAGLLPGVYHGFVTYSGPDTTPVAHHLPGRLPVTLVVWSDLPPVRITPSELVISALSGTSASALVTASSAEGPVSLVASAGAADGSDWLTARPFVAPSGQALAGSLTVEADASKLPPGTYYGSLEVRAPPDSPLTTKVPVTFNVTLRQAPYLQAGPPLVASLVNAATQNVGPLAPGEIVTMLGLGLGSHTPVSYQPDDGGRVAESLAGVRVLFDGVPAPLLYVSETQINMVVPYELANKASTVVAVEVHGMRFTTGAPVTVSAPGFFTKDGTGRGQAAAFNADTTPNSVENPAARGTPIGLLATGVGQSLPEAMTVKIGLTDAIIQKIEPVRGPVAGLVRLTVLVPQAVTPGPVVPVMLTVGAATSPVGVTIAVK